MRSPDYASPKGSGNDFSESPILLRNSFRRTNAMIKELEIERPQLRQTLLLEVEEHLERENELNTCSSKPGSYVQACSEELDRIQGKLDQLGVLLGELLEAVAAKSVVKLSYSTHEL